MLTNTVLLDKSWFFLNGQAFKNIYDIINIFIGSTEVLMLKLWWVKFYNARASPDLRSHTVKDMSFSSIICLQVIKC